MCFCSLTKFSSSPKWVFSNLIWFFISRYEFSDAKFLRLALQANSEVSALLGHIPSAVGYQPTLATDLGGLQEHITTKKGVILPLYKLFMCLLLTWLIQHLQLPLLILMPQPCCQDRFLFPGFDLYECFLTRFLSLDYPAVDPLDSTSRMLSPHVLGEEHYNTACGVRNVLQNYKNL